MLCGDTASATGRERGREVTTNCRGCHCPVSPSPGEKRGSQPRTCSGSGTWGQIRSGAAARRRGTRGQAVCGGLREALAGGQRVVEARGEAAAGVQHRRLLGDLLEKGFPPWKEAHGEVGHKRGREKEAPLGPWRRCCQLSLKPADLNLVGLCSSTCTSCSSSRTPGPNGPFYPPPGLFSPVLAVPFPALLAPSGHPCLGAVFPGRTNFDGGVLQGSGPQGYFIATLRVGKGSLQHAGPKHQGLTPKSCLQGSHEPHISQTSPPTPPEAKPCALLRFTSICWVAAPWCQQLRCSTVRFRDSHAPKGQG